MRSNVGCANVSDATLNLVLELVSGGGISLETRTLFLWPRGNGQILRWTTSPK